MELPSSISTWCSQRFRQKSNPIFTFLERCQIDSTTYNAFIYFRMSVCFVLTSAKISLINVDGLLEDTSKLLTSWPGMKLDKKVGQVYKKTRIYVYPMNKWSYVPTYIYQTILKVHIRPRYNHQYYLILFDFSDNYFRSRFIIDNWQFWGFAWTGVFWPLYRVSTAE